MAENNATCSICGKGYRMCISCIDTMKATPWRIHTDTAEHYKVYQILHGLTVGVYTEDEAKNKLGNVDLSDLEDFRPHIKQRIKDILKSKDSVEKIEPVENIEAVVKPTISRKRTYKTEVE
jgi:hypothetical protein